MELNFSQHTIRNISIVSRKFRAVSNRKIRQYGINNKMFYILRHIQHNLEIAKKQLCDIIKKDKAAITRDVSHLEKTELIKRDASEKDKRSFKLSIIDKGLELLPIIREIYQNMTLIALKDLDKKALESLNEILEKIENNILAHVSNLNKEVE